MTLQAAPVGFGGRALVTLLVLSAVVGLTRPAHAASVVSDGFFTTYSAAPGESNVVSFRFDYDETNDTWLVVLSDSGATIAPGTGCAAVSPNEASCILDDLDFSSPYLTVFLRDGADSFLAPADQDLDPCALTVYGGEDDDHLVGSASVDCLVGQAGNDTLEGGAGYWSARDGTFGDFLSGERGTDVLLGGAGPDSLAGGKGDDRIEGGPGFDVASYGGRHAPVRATLDARANDGVSGERDLIAADVEGVRGGRRSDVLIGNGKANQLFGGSGGDTLRGRGGKDLLAGDAGADDLAGGPGPDNLIGSTSYGEGAVIPERTPAPDRLRGGPGNDRLDTVDEGPDRLVDGGPGQDRAWIDRGLDRTRDVEAVQFGYGSPRLPPSVRSATRARHLVWGGLR